MMLTGDDARQLGVFLSALDKLSRETGVVIDHYEGVQLSVRGDSMNRVRISRRTIKQGDVELTQYYVTEDA